MMRCARSSGCPNHAKDELGVPDACLLFFDEVLAFDHVRKQIWMVVTADVTLAKPDEAYAQGREAAGEARKASGEAACRSCRQARTAKPVKVKRRTSKKNFLAAVERTKEYIAAGDIFQAVLSQRLDVIRQAWTPSRCIARCAP